MIASLLITVGVMALAIPILLVVILSLLTLITPMRFVNIAFEPRDVWLGIYWDRVEEGGGQWTNLYLYVTVIPTLPLMYVWPIYDWHKRWRGRE
jgi:hypothetical protein